MGDLKVIPNLPLPCDDPKYQEFVDVILRENTPEEIQKTVLSSIALGTIPVGICKKGKDSYLLSKPPPEVEQMIKDTSPKLAEAYKKANKRNLIIQITTAVGHIKKFEKETFDSKNEYHKALRSLKLLEKAPFLDLESKAVTAIEILAAACISYASVYYGALISFGYMTHFIEDLATKLAGLKKAGLKAVLNNAGLKKAGLKAAGIKDILKSNYFNLLMHQEFEKLAKAAGCTGPIKFPNGKKTYRGTYWKNRIRNNLIAGLGIGGTFLWAKSGSGNGKIKKEDLVEAARKQVKKERADFSKHEAKLNEYQKMTPEALKGVHKKLVEDVVAFEGKDKFDEERLKEIKNMPASGLLEMYSLLILEEVLLHGGGDGLEKYLDSLESMDFELLAKEQRKISLVQTLVINRMAGWIEKAKRANNEVIAKGHKLSKDIDPKQLKDAELAKLIEAVRKINAEVKDDESTMGTVRTVVMLVSGGVALGHGFGVATKVAAEEWRTTQMNKSGEEARKALRDHAREEAKKQWDAVKKHMKCPQLALPDKTDRPVLRLPYRPLDDAPKGDEDMDSSAVGVYDQKKWTKGPEGADIQGKKIGYKILPPLPGKKRKSGKHEVIIYREGGVKSWNVKWLRGAGYHVAIYSSDQKLEGSDLKRMEKFIRTNVASDYGEPLKKVYVRPPYKRVKKANKPVDPVDKKKVEQTQKVLAGKPKTPGKQASTGKKAGADKKDEFTSHLAAMVARWDLSALRQSQPSKSEGTKGSRRKVIEYKPAQARRPITVVEWKPIIVRRQPVYGMRASASGGGAVQTITPSGPGGYGWSNTPISPNTPTAPKVNIPPIGQGKPTGGKAAELANSGMTFKKPQAPGTTPAATPSKPMGPVKTGVAGGVGLTAGSLAAKLTYAMLSGDMSKLKGITMKTVLAECAVVSGVVFGTHVTADAMDKLATKLSYKTSNRQLRGMLRNRMIPAVLIISAIDIARGRNAKQILEQLLVLGIAIKASEGVVKIGSKLIKTSSVLNKLTKGLRVVSTFAKTTIAFAVVGFIMELLFMGISAFMSFIKRIKVKGKVVAAVAKNNEVLSAMQQGRDVSAASYASSFRKLIAAKATVHQADHDERILPYKNEKQALNDDYWSEYINMRSNRDSSNRAKLTSDYNMAKFKLDRKWREANDKLSLQKRWAQKLMIAKSGSLPYASRVRTNTYRRMGEKYTFTQPRSIPIRHDLHDEYNVMKYQLEEYMKKSTRAFDALVEGARVAGR